MVDERRRTETEKSQAGDYFSGSKEYYDQVNEFKVIKVFSGDCYTTDRSDEMMVTILGSCISVCMRDPVAKVGGMNHFLLPDSRIEEGASLRYGSYSMEQLINDLLKRGAQKQRFEIKVFGGGNVIKSSAMIGDKNVTFIHEYLKDEGLKIVHEDVGGTSPRRIHYYPGTGKVMMRKLNRESDYENVKKEEQTYQKKINQTTAHEKDSSSANDLELF